MTSSAASASAVAGGDSPQSTPGANSGKNSNHVKNNSPKNSSGVEKAADHHTEGTISGSSSGSSGTNFIRQIIVEDIAAGRVSEIVTRFPPEPNGFLHLGHAKSICLNFGIAAEFKGRCHLRFDDTNPAKEDQRYIDAIMEDVKWLGGVWNDHLYYTSDYFDQLYSWAEQLIKQGDAYVDHQSDTELKANRGSLTVPGVDSPFRSQTVEKNLRDFREMKDGKFPEGSCVLRAKIDMAHGNMNMRDPPIYRIKLHPHPRTGDTWRIYPIYDFAHGQSDSIERITHSICTLEFEGHRPLYEWFQEKLGIFKTRQIEFARLNCSHTVMSKRKLLTLVEEKVVNDWDDPRMPTLSGMRRRGFPSSSLRAFCEKVGVAKRDNLIQLDVLYSCVATELHPIAHRRFVVSRPLKVVIINYPLGEAEDLDVQNHPEDPALGTRKVKFGRELYIEETDYMESPPPKFFRLFPGNEVRLRYGYWIKCVEGLTHDPQTGEKIIKCIYDPTTRGGNAPADGRKVKGTLHWVSAPDAIDVKLNMYDTLFTVPTPEDPSAAGETPSTTTTSEGSTWRDYINKNSLVVVENAKAESSLAAAVHPTKGGVPLQFERSGFFVADYASTPTKPIFNLTIPLADSWAAKTDETSKDAQAKEAARIAREKAAAERLKKKEEKEKRALEKKLLKQPMQQEGGDAKAAQDGA